MAETAEKTPAEHEMKNRRRLMGFFLFPIALFPLLALISYRWQAIGELHMPPEASSNLIGVMGDAFAYNGYLLIGLAIWAVPPLTLFLGLLLVLGRSFARGEGSSRSCCFCSRRHVCCNCLAPHRPSHQSLAR